MQPFSGQTFRSHTGEGGGDNNAAGGSSGCRAGDVPYPVQINHLERDLKEAAYRAAQAEDRYRHAGTLLARYERGKVWPERVWRRKTGKILIKSNILAIHSSFPFNKTSFLQNQKLMLLSLWNSKNPFHASNLLPPSPNAIFRFFLHFFNQKR